jgi:hypothetical protein
MTPDEAALEPDAVVALHFNDLALADELAQWCSGEVARRVDVDGPEEQRVVVLVPTDKGPLPAHFGDWIVRRDEGDYYPCTPETFALLHEPVD